MCSTTLLAISEIGFPKTTCRKKKTLLLIFGGGRLLFKVNSMILFNEFNAIIYHLINWVNYLFNIN